MRYENLTEEEVDLILCLSEDTLDCVSTGEFTEDAVQEIFLGMMETYGISAPDLEEVIEEFVEEDVLDEKKVLKKFKRRLRGAEDDPELQAKDEPKDEPEDEPEPKPKTKRKPAKKKAPKVKRQPRAAKPKAKRKAKAKPKAEPEPEPEDEPKEKFEPKSDKPKKEKGLGDILKHALVGAVRQMYKRPEKTGEIVKKSVRKAGKKAVKHLARQGMKMVFGKWVKDKKGGGQSPRKPEPPQKKEAPEKKEESASIIEEVNVILGEGSRKNLVRRAWEKRGVVKMPRIDPDEYPPIKGMEGPFQFRSGRILYYDPKEGRYYDRKTDMYLSRNEDPAR